MKKLLIAIDALEMTSNGLQLIVRMDTETPTDDTEKISKLLSDLTDMAFTKDRMFMVTEDFGFSIRDLNHKTIVFKAIYRLE